MRDLIVLGGGAAGIFAALTAKAAHPSQKVLVLEKSAKLLTKVKISGGGRCNVTHSQFDPKALIQHYPRGGKELLGPFHRFQPKDTIEWFEKRGVKLKTEEDGRIFPTTDRSETIIRCLLDEASKLGVEIWTVKKVEKIEKGEHFTLYCKDQILETRQLLLATGSSKEGHQFAQELGVTITPTVPSLFTFNVPSSPLKELSGVALNAVELKIASHTQRGPLLITHFGFSGPAAIKLSAWSARELAAKNYCDILYINWLPQYSLEESAGALLALKKQNPQKELQAANLFPIPKSLWKLFVKNFGKIRDIPNKALFQLAEKLHRDPYQVEGKTTNKEEFVTCGGVLLQEVDFKTMQSKKCPGLYFAGEILDIDGVTGGFNFQSAWTTGYLAGRAIRLSSHI